MLALNTTLDQFEYGLVVVMQIAAREQEFEAIDKFYRLYFGSK